MKIPLSVCLGALWLSAIPQPARAAAPTAEQLANRPTARPPAVAPLAERPLGTAPAAGPALDPKAQLAPVVQGLADQGLASAVTPGDATDKIATAEKPAGFSYSMLRDAWVDDVRETYLYIKSSAGMHSSIAVPIPKNREFLAKYIHGGTIDDLVHSAIATVKWDPAGVIRPDITIITKVEVEIYDDAKVLDRGGSRLYITMPDGRAKGFELPGGAAAWDEVIEGAKFADLAVGTTVRVENDPGGRKPIRVIFKKKAPGVDAAGPTSESKGCGCDLRGQRELPLGAAVFGLGVLAALWLRRSRTI